MACCNLRHLICESTPVATRDEVLTAFERDGIPAKPTPYAPAGVRLATKPALQRHPLFLEGKVEVQDEGSQLLSYLVAPRRREMVVDFCAGAGGKTLALGALMHSEGRLYAFDTAEKRLTNLKPRLKRSALSNVHPQLISSESDVRVKRLAAKIDRVLVDAPCSGMGTLRRNPDLKWRQRPESVAEMAVKQRAILAAAARLIKPGGRLVYATCSLLPEENEAIVDGFLGSDPRFHLADSAEILRRQGIALDTGEYFRVFPHSHGVDGFFAAVLERAEEDAKKRGQSVRHCTAARRLPCSRCCWRQAGSGAADGHGRRNSLCGIAFTPGDEAARLLSTLRARGRFW